MEPPRTARCDSFRAMSTLPRSALALLLFSGWMALLFTGLTAGGAVHLLLAGAAAVFPWRAVR